MGMYKKPATQRQRNFLQSFKARNGDIICRNILGCDISTPEGIKEFISKDLFQTRNSMSKLAITMVTLKSHNHIVGDIERGVKVYNQGGVEWTESGDGLYLVRVPHKGDFKMVTVSFTKNGADLKHFYCHCTWKDKNPPVCRHVVAAVLSIQGGIVESEVVLGKSAVAKTTINEQNIANAVRTENLEVFTSSMMVALMEQAACACLADVLEPGETSVGTQINVSNIAENLIGAEITATATIEYVFGRRVEFKVTARDGAKEIGSGTHARVIVSKERFTKKLREP